MVIINWVSTGLIVIIFLVIFYCLFQILRVSYIRADRTASQTFQKKLALFRMRTHQKIVHYLVFINTVMGIVLLLVLYSFFHLNDQRQALQKKVADYEETTVALKQKSDVLYDELMFEDYPYAGVSLADYPWEELMVEEKQVESKAKISGMLCRDLEPYLGKISALLSVNQKKGEVSLSVIENSGDEFWQGKKVSQNIEQFLNEITDVKLVSQVEMIAKQTDKKNQTSSNTYVRNDETSQLEQVH
ncbi:hypothetical protein [Vagococcus acidifermentans]|uniref:Uncharacterized protein n=1 Tax=Vagococcus acidifermentans TaxID=564710 RepID=A0A430AVK7_9ENTE|nr:hypothetical protein [Vagococcus acidifermentans]RSU12081.1 hypothetical protein CBF27_06555 [Vagococcus acidifermentans]